MPYKDKEKKNKADLESYYRNKEKRLATGAIYYQNNREKKDEQSKKWFKSEKGKEYLLERNSIPANRLHLMVAGVKRRCMKSGLEFDYEFLRSFFENPPDKCLLCSKKLDYSASKNRREKGGMADRPSFDRVNNTRGYVKGNVQIICCSCNCGKSDLDLEKIAVLSNYIKTYGLFETNQRT